MINKKKRILVIWGEKLKRRWIFDYSKNAYEIEFFYTIKLFKNIGRLYKYIIDIIITNLFVIHKAIKSDIIISYGDVGLFLALIMNLFRKKVFILMQFNPKIKHSKSFKIFVYFITIKLAIRRIDYFVCHSKKQVFDYNKIFNIPLDKLVFIPYSNQYIQELSLSKTKNLGYIFSGGYLDRDYDLLVQAVENLNTKLIIVSGKGFNLVKRYRNIKIFNGVSKKRFIDILSKCKLVVIPLIEKSNSNGQVVALESMALGKPLIVTKISGIIDYVDENKTGVFVKESDLQDLKEKINHFNLNYDKILFLGRNGRKSIKNKFSFMNYSKEILKLINNNEINR